MSFSKVKFDLKFLTEVLPVLTIIGLGGSIAFNFGYFILPFNSGLFILNTQDLALTFLYVFGFILIVASIYFNFQDALDRRGRVRWLLIVVISLGAVLPSLKELFQNGFVTSNWASIRGWFWLGWSVFLLIIFGSVYVGKIRPDLYRLVQASIVFFSSASLFCFGAQMFINDFSSARMIDIKTPTETRKVAMISLRNSFILAVDPSNCDLMILDRQQISQLSMPLAIGSSAITDLTKKCSIL